MWYRETRRTFAQVGDGRIFIAAWLPQSAYDAFGHIEGLVDDLHLTFLWVKDGIDTPDKRRKILDAAERVCRKTEPLDCTFTEMGVMDNDDRTLVANIDIHRGSQFYAALVDEIEDAIGHDLEREHDFLPHVTLRKESDGDANVDDLDAFKWTIDEITVQFDDDDTDSHPVKLGGD